MAGVQMRTVEHKRARQKAANLVMREVYAGRLPRLSQVEVLCVDCGEKRARHYEHRNYGKPLDVRPVCPSCNHKSGKADVSPVEIIVVKPLKCFRCDYSWTPRNKNPLCCPSCKSRRWNIAPALPQIKPTK